MNEPSLHDLDHQFEIEETRPAGFWIRFGAYFIDFLIMMVVGIAIVFISQPVVYVMVSLLMIAYKPVLESTLGGTAGKLALGLRVIGSDGHRLPMVSAIVRSGIFILPAIPSMMIQLKMMEAGIGMMDIEAQVGFKSQNEALYIANYALTVLTVISCLVAAFNERKRGLHDMMADSYVIHEKKGHE